MLSKAILIAEKAHQGQVDKGGRPYIEHPLYVSKQLVTEEEKVVAILHDVCEDSDITLQDLKESGFPLSILSAVDAITKRDCEDYSGYLERLGENKLAVKVKLADMMHNSDISRIPTPSEKDRQRIEKYKQKIAFLQENLKSLG